MEFNIEGDFDNEDTGPFLKVLGELIINRVKQNIRDMDLKTPGGEGGAYLQGWFAKVSSNKLIIENTQDYAVYLEYGTYEFYTAHGEESFPEDVLPKKKDLPAELRKAFAKGMQPFAPVRRVMYNDEIMQGLMVQALEALA